MRYSHQQYTKETLERKIDSRLNNIKRRCHDKNIEFNLSRAHLRKLLLAKRCYFTGAPLSQDSNPSTGTMPWDSLTIDRIDCNQGYTDDNTVACCYQFNVLKGQLESTEILMTPAQFLKGLAKLIEVEQVNIPKVRKD